MAVFTLSPRTAFSLLDNQPEAIVYYTPVFFNTELIDFEIAYCNKEAAAATRVLPSELLGQKVSALSNTDSAVRQLIFQQLTALYQGNEAEEYTYFNPLLQKHLSVLRRKVEDGVLAIARDRTLEVQQQAEKDEQMAFVNSILDTSINAVFVADALRDKEGKIVDFGIRRINQSFTELLRLKEEEVVGKSYMQLFPSARENGTFDLNCGVVQTGSRVRTEISYKGDGIDGWYDISCSLLGKDRIVVSFANITEQKNAFLQIAQQKTLLDNLLQHSANGISVTQMIRNAAGEVIDGKTILANESAIQFTGLPRELYLGKTATELEPDILQSAYYQLCLKTLETGEPQFTQYQMQSTDRWLEISISKMDDDHIITIFTDITPVKETQLRLEKSLAELKRSNESLEEFTRVASHDLKEPIRKVQFFSDRLKARLHDRLIEEERSMMERMEHAASRMKLLVDDLLEYSHVNHRMAEPEAIDLNKKLALVLTDLDLQITEKGATIHAGKLPVVKGHRRQLQQLFHNLINNALKYHQPGVPPVIHISAREVKGAQSGLAVSPADEDKTFHLIQICDNGIGFEPEFAEKIFNVFTRLHGNQEYAGTGIGLAIVRKVVENHHGYVAAQSRPEEGSIFSILLPADDWPH